MDYLRVFETEYEKKRYGKNGDGGYVIADGLEYDIFISCGIGNDISFEKDFLDKYNIPCYAFDGTIEKLPEEDKRIQFIKKNIAGTESENTTNLKNLLESNTNVFIKMDIEGFEYEWIYSLEQKHLNAIKQLVIEFHNPFETIRFEQIGKISNLFFLCHLHPNDCCGLFDITFYNGEYSNEVKIPGVFECTFIRKNLCKNVKTNKRKIPDPILDFPNTGNEKFELLGYPYIW